MLCDGGVRMSGLLGGYFQHYWLIFKGSVVLELNSHCDLSSQCPTPSGFLVLSSNSVFADPSCPHAPCVLCYPDRSSILLPSPSSSAWLQNVDREVCGGEL